MCGCFAKNAWCGGFAIDRETGEAECVVAVPVARRDESANAHAARRASFELRQGGVDAMQER